MPGPPGRAIDEAAPLLRLSLFGRMHAYDATGRSILPRGRKTRALLAILALSPHGTAARGEATSLLWSRRENQQARASLRQAVHELQQALGSAAPRLLRTDRHHLALAVQDAWIDAVDFMRATPSQPEPLALFAQPLLGDLQGLDPAFDQWCARQAAHLTQVASSIGETILAAQADPAGTFRAAEQVLRIDPTQQAAWRAAITAHLTRNDHVAALAVYERCRSVLAQHGGRAPAGEIEELGAAIRRSVAPSRNGPRHRVEKAATASAKSAEGAVRLGVFPLRRIEPGADKELALPLVEEITTALAQFRWITCTAHRASEQSPFGPLQGPDADPAWAPWRPHPELDFMLTGTIQRSGGQVRVIVQLSDVRAGGTVVWGRRFDRDAGDIFALQDEIAAETAAQIDTTLLIWEGERARTRCFADPDAIELMRGAIPSIYQLEKSRFRKAGDLLETSLTIDPGNAAAHAWLAYWHLFLVGQGWAPDAAAATQRAAELAERAVGLDARDARAVTLAGHVRGFLNKRPAEALTLHDHAIALNPNLALAWCFSGLTLSYLGDHAEATRRIDHAQRLAPHDPHGFFFHTAHIMPHLLNREFEAAVAVGGRAIALNPAFSSAYKGQLSALGHLRRHREAAEFRRRLFELEPGFCIRNAIERSPLVREEDVALYADGLRQAGLPEG